jgi:hypothetical protein
MEKFNLSISHSLSAKPEQLKQVAAEDLEKRISTIWSKVELLKEVNYIATEDEKFSVAYRFMEIELEKVCREKEILKNSLIDIVQAYTR